MTHTAHSMLLCASPQTGRKGWLLWRREPSAATAANELCSKCRQDLIAIQRPQLGWGAFEKNAEVVKWTKVEPSACIVQKTLVSPTSQADCALKPKMKDIFLASISIFFVHGTSRQRSGRVLSVDRRKRNLNLLQLHHIQWQYIANSCSSFKLATGYLPTSIRSWYTTRTQNSVACVILVSYEHMAPLIGSTDYLSRMCFCVDI